jgi:hypothetical protein
MNAKRILWTNHAARRLRQRHITRQDVRWLLARGIRTVIPTEGPTTYWSCRGYLGKWEANVVFVEDATSQLIVSVEWVGDEGDEEYD